jgi:hypothetical protein
MNEHMLKSIRNIKTEALGMVHTLRAVKGERYAAVVHAALLADGLDQMLDLFADATEAPVEGMPQMMAEAGSQMITQIMGHLITLSGLSDDEVSEALKDADRIARHSHSLLDTANEMSASGKVMGN